MAKLLEKEQALLLRADGTSINQIAKQLSVSKSTVSVWCRDVHLSKRATKKIIGSSSNRSAAALLAYSQSKRLHREQKSKQNYEIGKNLVAPSNKRDVFCIGLGLYWGEGYKRGNREFGFTNSDPAMITFYLIWLQQVFSVDNSALTLRVSINAQHANRIKVVESYWSELTGVPLDQFTKPSLIKVSVKKQFSNQNMHYGTLRIKVKKGSDFREQVLGAIQHLSTLHRTL